MPDDILEYWSALARELGVKLNIEEFDTSSEMWSWENFGGAIGTLRNRLGIGDKIVDILGYELDLETGETYDRLKGTKANPSRLIPHLYYYTKARDEGIAGEWVKFNSLSGSWACRFSYDEEDVNALAEAFTKDKEKAAKALESFGATPADYGDLAYEISFLPMVRVLLVFEDGDEEFPPSVRLLYDKNSIYYLPHEMLGNISWMLVSRIFAAV